jgi:hypothetical protein
MKSLPIPLHLILNVHHGSGCFQPADTHLPLHIGSEHLILQPVNTFLKRLTLSLQLAVPVDLSCYASLSVVRLGR